MRVLRGVVYMNFRCKFKHRCLIRQPRFPIDCKILAIWRRFQLFVLHFICRISAIFLLPVCLTYWPRQYITPSLKLIWPSTTGLSRFWPFDLEDLTYMAGHVTNLVIKFEDHTPIRSWVMSYNVSHWLELFVIIIIRQKTLQCLEKVVCSSHRSLPADVARRFALGLRCWSGEAQVTS